MYYSLGYLPSKRRWYVLYKGSGLTPSINDIMEGTSIEGYDSHEDAYVAAERTGNTFISEFEITSLKEFEVGQIIKLAQDIDVRGPILLRTDIAYLEEFTINLFSGMEFQIAQLDKEHNTLYARAAKEKDLLISAPIHSEYKIFEFQ